MKGFSRRVKFRQVGQFELERIWVTRHESSEGPRLYGKPRPSQSVKCHTKLTHRPGFETISALNVAFGRSLYNVAINRARFFPEPGAT